MTQLVMCAVLVAAKVAMAAEHSGPYFQIDGDPLVDKLPLKSTSVSFTIVGSIAHVTVKQRYQNEGLKPIHAQYVFPASTGAAVQGMKMIIGQRIIEAGIREKAAARAEFEQAKAEGHRTALLEQHRPNVFSMAVANVMPRESIEVELRYSELLIPKANVYELVYPTVVGPRYEGARETPAAASFPPIGYLRSGELGTSNTLRIEGTISAPVPVLMPESSSHRVQVETPNGSAHVRLDPSERQGGNRDFILHYRLAGDRLATGLSLSQSGDENFFLLMVQPPKSVKASDVPPREYVFVVDVSGSMNGFPLDTTAVVMRNLLGSLRPIDCFNVLVFSGASELMSPQSIPATPQNVTRAVSAIGELRAGGGTELQAAVSRAMSLPTARNFARSFVVVTDGYIAEERGVFEYIREHLGDASLFAFGIGSSVNRSLIEGMAKAGLGEPFVVTRPEEAAAAGQRFIQYVQSPVLTNVKVSFDGFDAYDVEPKSIPTVFAERPVVIRGKWRGPKTGTVTLSGYGGSGAFVSTAEVSKTAVVSSDGNEALKALWARSRIDALIEFQGSPAEITQLGLKYRLLTEYTSFVAVDRSERVASFEAVDVAQPVPLPQGVSDEAVQRGAEPSLWAVAFAFAAMMLVLRRHSRSAVP